MKIIRNNEFEIAYDETKVQDITEEITDYINKERIYRKRLFSIKIIFMIVTFGLFGSTMILLRKSTNYAGLFIPFVFLLGFTVFLNMYPRTKLISNKKALKFKKNYAKDYISLINYLENYRLIGVVEMYDSFTFKFIDENEYIYKLDVLRNSEKYYKTRSKYKDNKTTVIDLTVFDWREDLEKELEELE